MSRRAATEGVGGPAATLAPWGTLTAPFGPPPPPPPAGAPACARALALPYRPLRPFPRAYRRPTPQTRAGPCPSAAAGPRRNRHGLAPVAGRPAAPRRPSVLAGEMRATPPVISPVSGGARSSRPSPARVRRRGGEAPARRVKFHWQASPEIAPAPRGNLAEGWVQAQFSSTRLEAAHLRGSCFVWRVLLCPRFFRSLFSCALSGPAQVEHFSK